MTQHRTPRLPRRRAAYLAAALAGVAVLLVGCGSSSSSKTTGVANGQSEVKPAHFAGVAAAPTKPEFPLVLNDSLGRPVNLTQFRGKAVLLTFIYTHCPDTCPLIVSHLRVAQSELGPDAKKMQIVAVSTDPRGDTPRSVAQFLKVHRMTGRMEYLIGSRKQLEPVWRAWDIITKAAPGPKDRVGHSALVYGISASGIITTLYPPEFVPQQIVHDVPLLAAR